MNNIKKIILIKIVIIVNTINLYSQNLALNSTFNKIYVIDTIIIKNAYQVVCYKENIVQKLYEHGEDLKFYYTTKMYIIDDNCLNKLQAQNKNYYDIYPSFGYYTINKRSMISLQDYIKIGTLDYEYINADFGMIYKKIFDSDSVVIYKYNKPETVFYVLLINENFFMYLNGESIEDNGKYVVVLIPKKPKQYAKNDD